jgi:hypothetical protein
VNCHSCHPRHHGDSDQEDERLDARFCHYHPPRRLAVRISGSKQGTLFWESRIEPCSAKDS